MPVVPGFLIWHLNEWPRNCAERATQGLARSKAAGLETPYRCRLRQIGAPWGSGSCRAIGHIFVMHCCRARSRRLSGKLIVAFRAAGIWTVLEMNCSSFPFGEVSNCSWRRSVRHHTARRDCREQREGGAGPQRIGRGNQEAEPAATRRFETDRRGTYQQEIAGALGMSENTVRVHVSAILKTLELTNRTQVAFLLNQLAAVTEGGVGQQDSVALDAAEND